MTWPSGCARRKAPVSNQASWLFRAAPFVAFSCYLTVSAIVPVLTNAPLPPAFLADLIGGAFVLSLASFALALAGLDTGLVTMGLGAIFAVLGILYALTERDLKRFLAYSTIESVGVIVTAAGAGMVFVFVVVLIAYLLGAL